MNKETMLKVLDEVIGKGEIYCTVEIYSEKKGEFEIRIPFSRLGVLNKSDMDKIEIICKKKGLWYWIDSEGLAINFAKD